MRISDYEAHGLREIPTHRDVLHEHPPGKIVHNCDSCRWTKSPAIKYRDWPFENPDLFRSIRDFLRGKRKIRGSAEWWFNFRAWYLKTFGAPCGRASLAGPRTGIDGYHIMAVDHDHPRPPIKENIGFYRRRKTWINFTPSGGWHDIYLVPRRYSTSELEKAGILCSGELLPKHDIVWWIPESERIPELRGGQSYFLHEPSTVNGRAYFFLDESRMNDGTLEIRRLDL